jgi:hypothetical protein
MSGKSQASVSQRLRPQDGKGDKMAAQNTCILSRIGAKGATALDESTVERREECRLTSVQLAEEGYR